MTIRVLSLWELGLPDGGLEGRLSRGDVQVVGPLGSTRSIPTSCLSEAPETRFGGDPTVLQLDDCGIS